MPPIIARVTVPVPVSIRLCRRTDLRRLEWYGLYWQHRLIFRDEYERQRRGENLMLVADLNGFPAAQAWVDLARRRDEAVGVIWAVRVYPFLQQMGLGARLIAAAEEMLRERGFRWAELGAEKKNRRALRLYERLGYEVVGEVAGAFAFTRPDGVVERRPLDEWTMRKQLTSA